MMENRTGGADLLLLEDLQVESGASVPSFLLLLLVYVFIVVANGGLVLVVCGSGRLRCRPMFTFLCHMSVNDVFGSTAVVPRLLGDLWASGSPRYLSYSACASQAFCVHLHASACHTILVTMAFDRYVAICSPLRYGAIMRGRTVAQLSAAAWMAPLVSVATLVGLSVRLSRCRSFVLHPFCDNASLFKLSCEDDKVLVNNVFGLAYTVVLLGSSVGSVALTYLKIAVVCVRGRNQALSSKALQTCATHLAAYVALLASAFTIVVLHRFPELSSHRKVAAVLGHVALPALNPVIYGLQLKEVRQRVVSVFHRRGV